MRKRWRTSVCGLLAAAATAALPLSVLAADPVATPPATQPVAAVAAQTHGKILVLPFGAVNPDDTRPWLGKSIQESLVADLTVSAPSRVVSGNETAQTPKQAAEIARKAGARYVVMGSFTSTQQELRITGQVIDAQTEEPVAGLKVTGNPDQLFHLEDGIAMQLKAQVLPDVLAAQERAGQQNGLPNQPAPGQYTGLQGEAAPMSPTTPYYSNYAYPYTGYPSADENRYYYTTPDYYYGGPGYVDYPLWSYPYCYTPFFSGIFLSGGFGFHHHDGFGFHDGFHHGFDGHGGIGIHNGIGSGHIGIGGGHIGVGSGHTGGIHGGMGGRRSDATPVPGNEVSPVTAHFHGMTFASAPIESRGSMLQRPNFIHGFASRNMSEAETDFGTMDRGSAGENMQGPRIYSPPMEMRSAPVTSFGSVGPSVSRGPVRTAPAVAARAGGGARR